MDSFFNLYLPGAVPLWCAVLFGVASLWGYSRTLEGDIATRSFARRGYGFFTLSLVISAAVLALCLWRRDFRVEYVYQYSGNELEGHFQLAAFWAGQKGSFLLWLLFGALLGLPLRKAAGRDEPTVMVVYLLTLFGLVFILVRENPFVLLPETPLDGAGLNPLLQNDWMVIHPPIMFVGYASAAIPFAFALSALWRRDTSRWAARAFPWALGGFMVLGLAIMLGGYWAYETLGWGGYWGWDPVENASLIPWLLGIVLVHGLYLERTRGRYRRLNLLLAFLVYLSVLYGTFLTRSGVLADFSVHSFVDLGISGWLVALMAFFSLSSLGLLAVRWKQIPTEPNEDPLFSRGSMLVLSTLTVGASAAVVIFGTSAPLLTGWFLEQPGQVGPEFYNTVNLPLALLTAILLAAVPFLTWRGTTWQELLRRLVPSAVAALLVTGIALAVGVTVPFHLLYLFLVAAAVAANLQKVVQLVRSSGLPGIGGYLSHVGVGVMLIGVLASSAYDRSAKATLPQGEPVQVGDLELTFERFVPRQGFERESLQVQVRRADGEVFTVYPKLFVNERTQQLMANPDIRTTLSHDLYVSPIQYEPMQPPRIDERLQMVNGESLRLADLNVRFVGLESLGPDPTTLLAAGRPVEVTAKFEIGKDGTNQRQPLEALYRFGADGRVETPPTALPDTGFLTLTGIDPRNGRIQVDVTALQAEPHPARLSVDVTHKPLIQLVWAGLGIILLGGALSTWKRARGARRVDRDAPATVT